MIEIRTQLRNILRSNWDLTEQFVLPGSERDRFVASFVGTVRNLSCGVNFAMRYLELSCLWD